MRREKGGEEGRRSGKEMRRQAIGRDEAGKDKEKKVKEVEKGIGKGRTKEVTRRIQEREGNWIKGGCEGKARGRKRETRAKEEEATRVGQSKD